MAYSIPYIQAEIAACCRVHGRSIEDIRLVAVTKTRAPTDLALLASCGIIDYGENRIDHLQTMTEAAPASARFHYLGRVQSRQFKAMVRHCDVLHSLASIAHVDPLAHACREAQRQLSVFIQVNVGLEPHKAGITPAALPAMLEALANHQSQLSVAGLMTMAPDRELATVSDSDVQRCFATTRELAARYGLQRLSMGMSGDFPIAIAEGATDLRIGSALFVEREGGQG